MAQKGLNTFPVCLFFELMSPPLQGHFPSRESNPDHSTVVQVRSPASVDFRVLFGVLIWYYVFANCPPPFLHRTAGIDWEKTSLKPYVALLDAHNKALMEETRRRKRGDRNMDVTTSGSFSSLAVALSNDRSRRTRLPPGW
jgi:hypothetical protein